MRSQVGGHGSPNGPGTEEALAVAGFVFYWLAFNTGDCAGYVGLQFLGDGTCIYTDGEIV